MCFNIHFKKNCGYLWCICWPLTTLGCIMFLPVCARRTEISVCEDVIQIALGLTRVLCLMLNNCWLYFHKDQHFDLKLLSWTHTALSQPNAAQSVFSNISDTLRLLYINCELFQEPSLKWPFHTSHADVTHSGHSDLWCHCTPFLRLFTVAHSQLQPALTLHH